MLVLFFAKASSSFAHLPNTAVLTSLWPSRLIGTLGSRQGSCQRLKELTACLEDYAYIMNEDEGLQSSPTLSTFVRRGLPETSRCPKMPKPSNPNPPRPVLNLTYLRGGSLAEFCRYHPPSLDHSIHEPRQCLDYLPEESHRSLPLHSTLYL